MTYPAGNSHIHYSSRGKSCALLLIKRKHSSFFSRWLIISTDLYLSIQFTESMNTFVKILVDLISNRYRPLLQAWIDFVVLAPSEAQQNNIPLFSNLKIKVLRQGTISSKNNNHVRVQRGCSARGCSPNNHIRANWRWDSHLNLWPAEAIICRKKTRIH